MTFKICAIGCGQLANSHHGPAYVKYAVQHPGTELAACTDLDLVRAEAFAARFGFRRYYNDPFQMLEAERPDAVCLLVPPAVTTPLSCQILMMNYPLLIEKPPGLTAAQTDQIIAAARRSGTPNQVAFNRRYTPLVVLLKRLLGEQVPAGPASGVQHLQYDFYRIGRTDLDFSTTAIHGIDTARFLAGSDYARINFHYQEFPALGPATANILMDCTFTSGMTAQLAFCPVSGAVIERATVHALDQVFFLNLPIWNAFDAPGSLVHVCKGAVTAAYSGPEVSEGSEDFVLNGFYHENARFFEDIRAGRRPAGDVESGRQPVEIAQFIRERRTEYTREEA
jgi:myo-inositol 2-dehydrogenase/D-chiro-inositol 1-dehydrogenase